MGRFLCLTLALAAPIHLAAGPSLSVAELRFVLPAGASAEHSVSILGAPESEAVPYAALARGEFVSLTPPAPTRTEISRLPEIDWGAPHAQGRLIVSFDDRLVAADVQRDRVHAAMGTALDARLWLINADVVVVNETVSLEVLAARYTALTEVVQCEPDLLVTTQSAPNDPLFPQQWALHNTGDREGAVAGADIDAPGAWDVAQGSAEVIVAVIDTGMDVTHPEFAGRVWINSGEVGDDGGGGLRQTNGEDDDANGYVDDVFGYDFSDDDSDPSPAPFSWGVHGTVVAGIVGATQGNGVGVSGVAPTARIMPLKVFSDTGAGTPLGEEQTAFISDLMEAIQYAHAQGAIVFNVALGSPDYQFPWTQGSQTAFRQLLQAVGAEGGIVIAAVGHDRVELDGVTHFFPATLPEPNIIAVGASSWDDFGWVFSDARGTNWGTEVDLLAPGYRILSTALGVDYTEEVSGTSVAVPHVSGVAALLLADNPWARWPELSRWICDGVDVLPQLLDNPDVPGTAPMARTGGRLNARNSLLLSGPPWLVLGDPATPEQGVIAPGASAEFAVAALTEADEIGLALGEGDAHSAQIRVVLGEGTSPSLSLPITLRVIGTGSPPANDGCATAEPISSGVCVVGAPALNAAVDPDVSLSQAHGLGGVWYELALPGRLAAVAVEWTHGADEGFAAILSGDCPQPAERTGRHTDSEPTVMITHVADATERSLLLCVGAGEVTSPQSLRVTVAAPVDLGSALVIR